MEISDQHDGEAKNEPSSSSPLILHRTVGDVATSASASARRLRLAMLGCEDKPPYGPTAHTGALLLDLISQTLQKYDTSNCAWDVSIAVYRVQQGEYPEDWDAYDLILLPGSFSAAYDNVPWIEKLKTVIQEEIVPKRRSTLGICFGHQILAQSFDTGNVIKYPAGSRGGRYSMKTTKEGSTFFGGQESVDLYYTHGDAVEKLPKCAVALGQEGPTLPAQSAAYFVDEEEALKFRSNTDSNVKPYAVTFQAHPEYAVSRELGLSFTLQRILNEMAEKGVIESEFRDTAEKEAADRFEIVQEQSLAAIAASLKALGWIP